MCFYTCAGQSYLPTEQHQQITLKHHCKIMRVSTRTGRHISSFSKKKRKGEADRCRILCFSLLTSFFSSSSSPSFLVLVFFLSFFLSVDNPHMRTQERVVLGRCYLGCCKAVLRVVVAQAVVWRMQEGEQQQNLGQS